MMVKAGYKTSEFWFTLVSFIFSGLYLTGLLKENSQKEELISVVSHAVESIILIGGQALIFYRYIKGRSEVKKLVAEQEQIKPKTTTKSKRKTTTKKKKVSSNKK